MFVAAHTGVIGAVMYLSLRWIWTYQRDPRQSITFDNLLLLLLTYIIVLVGFGLIYTTLTFSGLEVLLELEGYVKGTYFEVLGAGMYFSAVTLFSVGYGDITPIGIGRWLAVLEALLGYAMPAGFVVRTVIDFENRE